MSELDLGQATIVYEDPDEGRTAETLDNEQVVYARDHWMIKAGTDDEGNDVMRQLPRDRVHYVERSVEQFEEEASTVRHRIESLADDLRRKIPVSGPREPPTEKSERVTIETGDDPGRE